MQGLLARLEAQLGPLEGRPAELAGGITNRNLCARLGGRDYVIRLAGRDTHLLGIDRRVEREAAEAAHRAGVAPAVAAFLADEECLVTAFASGDPMTPGAVRAAIVQVAAAVRAVHGAGRVAADFSPFRTGERYAAIAMSRGVGMPAAWEEAADLARRIEGLLGEADPVLCHNDLLSANLLAAVAGESRWGVWIVDWEYAGMGDRFFDLGNLSVNNELEVEDDERLVEAYFGTPDDALLARVRLMRAVSDYREGMWGVAQQALSELDVDFASYAATHLERMVGSDWREWARAAAS